MEANTPFTTTTAGDTQTTGASDIPTPLADTQAAEARDITTIADTQARAGSDIPATEASTPLFHPSGLSLTRRPTWDDLPALIAGIDDLDRRQHALRAEFPLIMEACLENGMTAEYERARAHNDELQMELATFTGRLRDMAYEMTEARQRCERARAAERAHAAELTRADESFRAAERTYAAECSRAAEREAQAAAQRIRTVEGTRAAERDAHAAAVADAVTRAQPEDTPPEYESPGPTDSPPPPYESGRTVSGGSAASSADPNYNLVGPFQDISFEGPPTPVVAEMLRRIFSPVTLLPHIQAQPAPPRPTGDNFYTQVSVHHHTRAREPYTVSGANSNAEGQEEGGTDSRMTMFQRDATRGGAVVACENDTAGAGPEGKVKLSKTV